MSPVHAPAPGPRRSKVAIAAAMALSATFTLSACGAGGSISSTLNPAIISAADQEQTKLKSARCMGNVKDAFDAIFATGSSGELSEDQNKNAQAIIGVAESRGLGKEGAAIGIATALVESELNNVDYGDDIHGVTNPDGSLTTSLGLFQQQEFWGDKETRMDPAGAAGLFYDHLEELDWKGMDPGQAAQAVQGSAFPDKYGQRMTEAESIVESVGTGFTEGGGDSSASSTSSATGDATDAATDDETATSAATDDETPSGESTASASSSASSTASASSSSTSGSSDSSSSSSGACPKSTSGAGAGAVTAGSEEGDDVPESLRPAAQYIGSGFSPETDPWGLYKGQCVSYVAWRLNVSMGHDPKKADGDWPFTMEKMGMAGQGNASEWSAGLEGNGYKTDDEPKPGAVVWWDSNVGPTGDAGHVAVVEHVGKDDRAGQVYVSQYNVSPKQLQYSEQWIPVDQPSGYIHVADYPDGESRVPYPGE